MAGQSLFARGTERNAPIDEMKYNLESWLSEISTCLTTGHMCKYWLMLRQLRVTGTNDELFLAAVRFGTY